MNQRRTVEVPCCDGPDLKPGTKCDRPGTAAFGLCVGHYGQRRRGLELRPLRDPDAPALVNVGIRVTPDTRAAVLADVAGARAVLESWAKQKGS